MDAHFSRIEQPHQVLKIFAQIREGCTTRGLGRAIFEHVIESCLLGPREVERASGVNRYGGAAKRLVEWQR